MASFPLRLKPAQFKPAVRPFDPNELFRRNSSASQARLDQYGTGEDIVGIKLTGWNLRIAELRIARLKRRF
jgi:hypothetical protein